MNRPILNPFLMLLKSLLTAHTDLSTFHKTLLVILLTNSTYLLHAQTVPARIEKLELGIQGFYKTGCWTPVQVTIRGSSSPFQGTVTLQVADDDDIFTSSWPKSFQLEANQNITLTLYAKPGRQFNDWVVHLYEKGIDNQGVPLGKRIETFRYGPDKEDYREALTINDHLFMTLGGVAMSQSVLPDSDAIGRTDPDTSFAVARIDQRYQLPTEWFGFDSVDVIVMGTSNKTDLDLLTESRWTAIEEWIRRGGRLVVSVAKNWDQVTAAHTGLAKILPATFSTDGTVSLRQLTCIDAFCESKTRLLPSGNVTPVQVAQLTPVRGRTLAREGRLPIIIRAPYRFGEVTLVALDLDQTPFDRWSGRDQFWATLLGFSSNHSSDLPNSASSRVGFWGVTELISQLRGALHDFEEVKPVSFIWVASLITIYILLIGPGDYFFLKKVLKKLEWTWLSFPLIALTVSLLAYFSAYFLKGTELRVNQVELIDIHAETGLVNGSAWTTLFSPVTDTYNLSVEPKLGIPFSSSNTLMSWLGTPESTISGMYRNASVNWFDRGYRFNENYDSLIGLPIRVWSTKSLSVQWERRSDALFSIEGPKGRSKNETIAQLWNPASTELRGSLVHYLPSALEDCLLAFGKRAYILEDLPPGQTRTFGGYVPHNQTDFKPATRRPRFLKEAIQGTTVNFQEKARPYRRVDTNLDKIMPMILFYNSADGESHTGLTNRSLETRDWTRHLESGYAILFGKLKHGAKPRPLSPLLRDGEPLNARVDVQTYVRFLIPVYRGNSSP